MARTNGAVSVTTAATPIAALNPGRNRIVIQNNGAATLFIGDASVTTANGIAVAAGSSFTDVVTPQQPDSNFAQAWYGIVASGTCDVRVLEG